MSLLNQKNPPPILSTAFIGLFTIISLSIYSLYNLKKSPRDYDCRMGMVEYNISSCKKYVDSNCHKFMLIKLVNYEKEFKVYFDESMDSINSLKKNQITDTVSIYFDLNSFNENHNQIQTVLLIENKNEIFYTGKNNYKIIGFGGIISSFLILVVLIYLYNKNLIS